MSVGVSVGVAVGVAVSVGISVGIVVGVSVTCGVAVGVAVSTIAPGVPVPVAVAVAVVVGVAVLVGVAVGVFTVETDGATTVNGSETTVPWDPRASIVRPPLVAPDGIRPVQLELPVAAVAFELHITTDEVELR